MKKNSENRSSKGFSLIELVIVIAIMIALIAVMAPSFLKYIKKARDVAISDAAEQCIDYVKAEYDLDITGEGTIRIGRDKDTGSDAITLTFQAVENNKGETVNTLACKGKSGDDGLAEFKKAVGFVEGKICKTDLVYYIHIRKFDIDNHPQLSSRAEFEVEEEITLES